MEEKKIMTYSQVMAYVEELARYGSVPGLTNIENLCSALENPQRALKFIHIAGTNGKGSVLAFLSEIMKAAGYRTGRYISPVIFEYRERIQVNGRPVSKKELCRQMTRMKEICERLVQEGKPHPTAFEIETAMAFQYFREQKCEIVILETGLGGLLDATNIVSDTVAAVFTSVSFDHMAVLGKTLKEIAENKAGIMKAGAVAVALKGEEEVMEVFERKAHELKIPLVLADPRKARNINKGLEKQSFSYGKYDRLTIRQAGSYQIENALLAVQVTEEIQKRGFSIPEKALYKGLYDAFWPGRFQVISSNPCFVIDGAHNRDGAGRLAESVRFYFTNRRILYIIGILRDKEQREILKAACPLAEQVFTISTRGARGLSAYELAQTAGEYHSMVTAADSIEEAVELAYLCSDKDTVIIAFGSLSWLGEVTRIVEGRSLKGKKQTGRNSHGKQRKS